MKDSNSISDRVVEYVISRKVNDLGILSVENVAANLKINRSHLSRTFKSEKSFTIEEFIFKIKIIRAASMLKDNAEMTIKEIAAKLGFSRCDYFIRIFKRYFGTTPARYKDLIQH